MDVQIRMGAAKSLKMYARPNSHDVGRRAKPQKLSPAGKLEADDALSAFRIKHDSADEVRRLLAKCSKTCIEFTLQFCFAV